MTNEDKLIFNALAESDLPLPIRVLVCSRLESLQDIEDVVDCIEVDGIAIDEELEGRDMGTHASVLLEFLKSANAATDGNCESRA
ncbi:hypothetical protein [Kordiimonas sp.]|uniref:hypothetical protein n=1 Tax=Kordiimonas sp. TaxID=1970157 RepID=UPI003A8CF5EA